MTPAIALFTFARPATTARVFAAVRAARPSRLFIIGDGPRPDRPDEAARCAEVRRLVEGVDWPCTVEHDYADRNMGCRTRISSGIRWVFSRVDEAIFLEDDTLPDATFFPYCEELLARFRNDDRVIAVSGSSMLTHGSADGASYWFSAHPRIWGWASWRRAWDGYDVEMSDWPAMRESSAWRARTPLEQRAWGPFFDDVKAGLVDTWDAQFTLLAWKTGRLCAIPSKNLVDNIGFGVDATNTHAPEFPGPRPAAMAFPLRHPASVVRDAQCDAEWMRIENPPPPGLVCRILRRVKRLVLG